MTFFVQFAPAISTLTYLLTLKLATLLVSPMVSNSFHVNLLWLVFTTRQAKKS